MKTLSVDEIKTYLNKGIPDDELMRAFGLSPSELKDLFDQLIRAMANGSPYVHIKCDAN